MRLHIACWGALFVGLATAIPVVLAWPSGADPGLSGGPAGYLVGQGAIGNCTACHEDAVFGGPGAVELLGVPRRYRAGAIYEFSIRVFDPELEPVPIANKKVGAGFEISAEGSGAHQGDFLVDPADEYTAQTGYVGSVYVTHTRPGVEDSRSTWLDPPERAYDYYVSWQAPATNSGPVTLFASGLVANDHSWYGDRYYSAYATLQYAVPGDADGDTDLDLYDFAVMQRCFSGDSSYVPDECQYLDADNDATIALSDAAALANDLTGPIAAHPGGFVLADFVRGGLLYDKWWIVADLTPPGDTTADNHPLWPPFSLPAYPNPRTGAATWRCKECHGWDYKGVQGAYGDVLSDHRTNIPGILGTTKSDQELFDMLKNDDLQTPMGHSYGSVGLTDEDIWALVKMTRDGVVDTDFFIHPDESFNGDDVAGSWAYGDVCASCHDFNPDDLPNCEGAGIGFENGETVGSIANDNPWELLHKIRFGHPGAPMPALELLDRDVADAADLGAYCATLSVGPCS